MPQTVENLPPGDRPHQPDEDKFHVIHSEDVQWRSFAAFPPEARLAVLVGNPTQPGPYVIRVRLPAGTKMMPHKHPEDRIYTVLSGIFYVGLGEVFDEEKLNAYAPGTVVVLPGGQPHFHWAKSGEYITQVSAIGPLGLGYIDPATDPRNRGQAPKADDPAQAMQGAPALVRTLLPNIGLGSAPSRALALLAGRAEGYLKALLLEIGAPPEPSAVRTVQCALLQAFIEVHNQGRRAEFDLPTEGG